LKLRCQRGVSAVAPSEEEALEAQPGKIRPSAAPQSTQLYGQNLAAEMHTAMRLSVSPTEQELSSCATVACHSVILATCTCVVELRTISALLGLTTLR
jgi:hypothetical protein